MTVPPLFSHIYTALSINTDRVLNHKHPDVTTVEWRSATKASPVGGEDSKQPPPAAQTSPLLPPPGGAIPPPQNNSDPPVITPPAAAPKDVADGEGVVDGEGVEGEEGKVGGEEGDVEFPHADMARLDEMINRPRWVVPVLQKGELEVLLEATIDLCKRREILNYLFYNTLDRSTQVVNKVTVY